MEDRVCPQVVVTVLREGIPKWEMDEQRPRVRRVWHVFKKLHIVQLTRIRRSMNERREKRRVEVNCVTGEDKAHRGHEMLWQEVYIFIW